MIRRDTPAWPPERRNPSALQQIAGSRAPVIRTVGDLRALLADLPGATPLAGFYTHWAIKGYVAPGPVARLDVVYHRLEGQDD